MQELKLRREILSNKAVLGSLQLDNEEICKTLENPWLNNQPFISCIPAGKYIVKKYSSHKYPDVWELQNVDGRSKILIHNGNLEKHTQGCILVGATWGFIDEELAVLNSNATLNRLRKRLDNEFSIEIINIL
jgi:hypothetical protein